MLNRRILRVKVFKTVYSYAENPGMSLKEAEALLDNSCEATRDLYLYMLSIIGPLTAEAKNRIESARNKFNPTEEERNPNLKFTKNRIAEILAADPDFGKIVSRKKLSWEQNDMFLRHLYETIRDRKYFKDYLESGEDSLAEDAALFKKIFEKEFVGNAELAEILEDMSIYWNDDLSFAVFWCCNTLTDLGEGEMWSLPTLYQNASAAHSENDREFVVKLLRAAFAGFGRYYGMIAENTPKWDKNRICATDLALIVCGLAEADTFSNITSRITINEYVEISKYYSTPESRSFVNGLLDKLINKH